MKNLLFAALLALPLSALASDPPKGTTDTKPSTASQADPKASGGANAKGKPARSKVKKGAAADTKAQAAPKSDPSTVKQEEKPCEPVKPCSID